MPFIFKCFHDKQYAQWHKKALRKYQTRKSPDSQNVFLSFFFFFRRLVQNCVTLSGWYLHKTAAFYTEQCTSPLLFHNFEVSKALQFGH